MTGISTKIQQRLEIINESLQNQKTQTQIAQDLGISRGAINETIRTYLPKWRLLKPTKEVIQRHRLTDLEVSQHARFVRKRQNTKDVNKWEFSILINDIQWPTHCPILGIELDYFADHRVENSVSFDRLDPTKGYIPGNVIITSWRANRIKNDGTAEEHRRIACFIDGNLPGVR